jgi:hypothetical protein
MTEPDLSLAAALALSGLLACSPTGSSADPESLGYGSASSDPANGYEQDGPPFDRPAPQAWPLEQQPAQAWIATPPVLPPAPIEASPDVRQLCVHVVEFLVGQAEGEPMDVAIVTEFCHLQARTEKLARTAEQWQALLGCMLAADTEPEFDACEVEHPTALAEPTEHEREREVCQHLAMTTLYEQMGSDTNLRAEELERFRPVVRQCVTELISEERAKRSPEDYAALLDCVLEQSTSEAMEACE